MGQYDFDHTIPDNFRTYSSKNFCCGTKQMNWKTYKNVQKKH